MPGAADADARGHSSNAADESLSLSNPQFLSFSVFAVSLSPVRRRERFPRADIHAGRQAGRQTQADTVQTRVSKRDVNREER